MTFLDGETDYYERILFVAFAVIAALCCVVQLIFFQELKIIPVYLLPFLSFCICFENICLYRQENHSDNSSIVHAAYVFHSFIVPIFIMLVYEVPFRLHETRLAHFGCIPFEQGSDMPQGASRLALVSERFIAVGFFVMNIIVNFDLFKENDKSDFSGIGGYKTLAEHPRSLQLWLSLIPSITLSALGIYICFVLYKYAKHCTLGISNNRYWRAIIPCTLLQAVGQCFGVRVYQVTSNAGEIALLIGVTFIVGLVQRDLLIAGNFANFLKKSNDAFRQASALELQAQHNHSSSEETPKKYSLVALNMIKIEEDRGVNLA